MQSCSSGSTSAPPASRASRSTPTARCSAAREAGYPLSTPHPGWAEQDPEQWWRASGEVLARLRTASGTPAGDRPQRPDARARRPRRRTTGCCARRSSGTTSARRQQCEQIEATIGPRRADRADRQPRPDRLHRAQAAVAARARARRLCARDADRAAQGLRAPATVWRARHRRLRRVGHAAARRGPAAAGASACSQALEIDPAILPARARGAAGAAARRRDGVPVAAGGGDQAAGALGVGVHAPGPLSVVLGTSGVVFAALEQLRRRLPGARPRLLPRGARRPGTRWA